jgi:hypothetical protein
MRTEFVVMAGNSYLCDHGSAFAWTQSESRAKRFPSEAAAKQYFKDLVGGEPRAVKV